MNDILKMSLPFVIAGVALSAFTFAWPRQPRRARVVSLIIAMSVGLFVFLLMCFAFGRDMGVEFRESYAPGFYAMGLVLLSIPVAAILFTTWLVMLISGDRARGGESGRG